MSRSNQQVIAYNNAVKTGCWGFGHNGEGEPAIWQSKSDKFSENDLDSYKTFCLKEIKQFTQEGIMVIINYIIYKFI